MLQDDAKFDPRSGKPRKTLAQLLGRYRVLPNGCHEWTGTRNKYGYGIVCLMVDGVATTITAHRLQWFRTRGKLDPGHEACHDCPDGMDNRACINPDHLWAGSHGANIRDCVSKGRHNHSALTRWMEKYRRGEVAYTPRGLGKKNPARAT